MHNQWVYKLNALGQLELVPPAWLTVFKLTPAYFDAGMYLMADEVAVFDGVTPVFRGRWSTTNRRYEVMEPAALKRARTRTGAAGTRR